MEEGAGLRARLPQPPGLRVPAHLEAIRAGGDVWHSLRRQAATHLLHIRLPDVTEQLPCAQPRAQCWGQTLGRAKAGTHCPWPRGTEEDRHKTKGF